MSQKRQPTRAISVCEGKVAFASFDKATGVSDRNREVNRKRHAYHCDVCHLWHLGQRAGKSASKTVKALKRARLMELRGEDD